MLTQGTTSRARRRVRRQRHDTPRQSARSLPERVDGLREEAFELVAELHRSQAKTMRPELDATADKMQSIANQLGDIQASLAAQRA